MRLRRAQGARLTRAPVIGRYRWAGGEEHLLRFGPGSGAIVIAALPLFEEANRTRAFVVAILRALAERGIGSVLPDLPGQGDSLVPLETVTVATMQAAYRELAERIAEEGRECFGLGVRSGALIDATATLAGRWHLAPQRGSSLARELKRISRAGATYVENNPVPYNLQPASASMVEVAGNLLAPDLLRGLEGLEPHYRSAGRCRIVRLSSDTRDADRRIDAVPLWRQREPGTDAVLSQILADDIADWLSSCVA